MQDIKSRELREKDSNTNTIYFEVRATTLCPCLHTEGFQLSTKNLLQRTTTKELQLTTGNTQLQLSHTSTQEDRHKAKHKVKKITTW